MKLREISPSDPITSRGIDGLEETCPLLMDVEFYSKSGPADSVKRAPEGNAPAANKITRSLNESVSSTPAARNYDPVTKKIVSYEASADVQLEDRNEDPEAELSVQTYLESWERGYALQNLFINGDIAGDAEDFNGFVNIVDAGNILTDGTAVPVGGDVAKAQQQKAIETFLRHKERVRGGASHVYMNGTLKVRWVTVAKALGYYERIQTIDGLIETIGEVVIRSAGQTKAGGYFLPFTEAGTTSSMWFVRWGERVDCTVLTSVGLKGRYIGQEGSLIKNNFNLDAAMHLQNKHALYKSSGWSLD